MKAGARKGSGLLDWADGGETRLANLVLLCRRHHRRVHEDGWTVVSDSRNQVVFFTPRGRALFEAPEPPEPAPDPAARLVARNRDRGVRPDGATREPKLKWGPNAGVPWAVEAAAREALDPA